MRNRTSLAFGVLLIALGAWFLLERQVPNFHQMAEMYLKFPYYFYAIGGLMFVVGLATGAPGLSVPATILAGVGGIFHYQQFSGDYSSWSYLWPIIIGCVGLGDILYGLLDDRREKVRSGAGALFTGAVLFVIFAAIFGKLAILGPYGPAALLILAGFVVILRGFKK